MRYKVLTYIEDENGTKTVMDILDGTVINCSLNPKKSRNSSNITVYDTAEGNPFFTNQSILILNLPTLVFGIWRRQMWTISTEPSVAF